MHRTTATSTQISTQVASLMLLLVVIAILGGCGGSSEAPTVTRAAAAASLSDFRSALLKGDTVRACDDMAPQAQNFVEKQNFGNGTQNQITCPKALQSALQAPGRFKSQLEGATLVRTTASPSGADVYFNAFFGNAPREYNKPAPWYAKMVNSAGIWQIADVCMAPNNPELVRSGRRSFCIIGA